MFLILNTAFIAAQTDTVAKSDVISAIVDFKWPIIVLVALAIFYMPIKNLINRLKSGKLLGNEFQTNEVQQQQSVVANKHNTNVDKALGLYRQETVDTFQKLVVQETALDTFKTDSEKQNVLYDYATALYIKIYLENIYTDILGSQIALLQYLNSILGVGDTYANLKKFYDQASLQNPAAFTNYTYDEYFNFLINRSLVVAGKDKYLLTNIGVDFLKYLTDAGKAPSKNY